MYSGRYLVKNKLLKFYLYVIYYLSSPIGFFVKKDIGNTKDVKRILVANGAHLGDITILISSVNALKASSPDLKVDLITGSWNKPVINYYDVFDEVYFLDHWKLNRSKKSIVFKLLQYYKTFIKSCFLVRKKKYTLAIDTYHFYPNSSLFLFFCRIKNRLGYSSGGFDNFYNQALEWKMSEKHIVYYHIELFEYIFNIKLSKPFFNSIKIYGPRKYFFDDKYIILCPGAGENTKMWGIQNWKILATLLLYRYNKILLVGAGDRESDICSSIADNDEHIINLCNKTSLMELGYLIYNSSAVICLDSFVSHFAAQFDTWIFRIEGQNYNIKTWSPISNKCVQICYNSEQEYSGVEHMRLIEPSFVDKILQLYYKETIDK